MRLTIKHSTEYTYDEPVEYGLQRLRLTPRTRTGQTVVNWETVVDGAVKQASYRDHFNNETEMISIVPGSTRINVTSMGDIETSDVSGVIGVQKGFAPLWLFSRETDLTAKSKNIAALAKLVEGDDDIARMHHLMALIADRVTYLTGTTDVTTTADQALMAGNGVCQDHSHIFATAARLLGYPTRYVSGFLMMDGQTHQAASHAWVEVFINPLGWVGFDVSNGISPDERYVAVATGLDYRDAAPISGIRHGTATETLAVSVIVEQ